MKFYNTRRIHKGVTAVRAPSEIWSGGVSAPNTQRTPSPKQILLVLDKGGYVIFQGEGMSETNSE